MARYIPRYQTMTKDGLLSFEEEVVGGRITKYYCLTRTGHRKKAAYVEELEQFIASINRVEFPEPTL